MVPTPVPTQGRPAGGAVIDPMLIDEHAIDELAGWHLRQHRPDAPRISVRRVLGVLPAITVHRRRCLACDCRWTACRYAQTARTWLRTGRRTGRSVHHA